jgi:GTPase Era involved in 16S rRNA processing
MSNSEQEELLILLDQTVEQLDGFKTDFSGEAERLTELKNRFLEGRFHLAVLGQFKRGKSTLLNALLGEAVLPTAVVPLTAIPTFIQAASDFSVRVLFEDQPPALHSVPDARGLTEVLSTYVTESKNPNNHLNVLQVEVSHPAGILRNGVVLIDTPGIGSTFKHNTEATLNFLPQCDAAMFLVSADPPITEVEIEFLKQVRQKVHRLFFILNKTDYLTDSEREEILAFLKKTLCEQVGMADDTHIFCVSARRALQARQSRDLSLWAQSGLDQVESYLIHFLAHEKTEALRHAVRKKASDILTEILMRMQISVSSLQMPLGELENKLDTFNKKLAELQHTKQAEMDIFEGDKKRMNAFVEEHAEQLRRKTRAYLQGIVENLFTASDAGSVHEETIETSLAEVIPGFFEHEMGRSTEIFQEKMRQTLQTHRERLRTLIDSIRQTAAEIFRIPYHQSQSVQDFEMVHRPYWVSHKWGRSFRRIPRGVLDRILPAGLRKSQLSKRAAEQIDELVIQNVENLRWAILQNIDDSFIRFHSEMENRYKQTLTATQGAIEAAMKKRKEQSELVSEELSRLDCAIIILQEIRESFEDGRSSGSEIKTTLEKKG